MGVQIHTSSLPSLSQVPLFPTLASLVTASSLPSFISLPFASLLRPILRTPGREAASFDPAGVRKLDQRVRASPRRSTVFKDEGAKQLSSIPTNSLGTPLALVPERFVVFLSSNEIFFNSVVQTFLLLELLQSRNIILKTWLETRERLSSFSTIVSGCSIVGSVFQFH